MVLKEKECITRRLFVGGVINMSLLLPRLRKRSGAMDSLRDQLNRVFEEAFSDFALIPGEESITTPSEIAWGPSVEAYEEEKQYVIKAALPGVKKENITIEVDENSVTISGEHRYENETKQENLYRNEFSYGKFSRSFTLGKAIKAENVNADYKDGILTLTLPKQEVEKPKKIKVNL